MTTGLVLSVVAAGAGLAATAGPAYADVTSANYTIGTPTGSVSSVSASPSGVVAGTATNFEVAFTATAALSGANNDWVSVQPSQSLGSAPTNVDLIAPACIQSGTAGAGGAGAAAANLITVELQSSCSITQGAKVEVDFTANAPASGTLSFAVTTSTSSSPATSNLVTIGTSAATLSANIYADGANSTYSITGVPISGVATSASSVTLVATGAGVVFYNNPADFVVTYTPRAGTPVNDPVQTTSGGGTSVTLNLANPVANLGTLDITATVTNPAAGGTATIQVTPAGGTAVTTNSITFGNEVTNLSVAPSSTIAGASTEYVIGFKATDAISAGGDIFLSETNGPTNFASVTGILVTDTTLHWNSVVTGASLASGTATIPVANTINAGDTVEIILAGVTNPPASTVNDFDLWTTPDPVMAAAPTFAIGANASPGVVVTVSPSTTGSLATYTISNIHASAGLAAGSSTVQLQAPAGTVFPNNPAFYHLVDATNASGSGVVTAALSGGGTNAVTLTVPNSINSGDALTLIVQDVINPSTAGSTDAITLVGNVTGPAAVAPTTTTTTRPKPVLGALTGTAHFSWATVQLKLSCATAACKGMVTLTDVRTVLGSSAYSVAVGKQASVVVRLSAKALGLIAAAKGHEVTVTESATVTGGATVTKKVTLALVPAVSQIPVKVTFSGNSAPIKLSCGEVNCQGKVTLVDVTTTLGTAGYSIDRNTSKVVEVPLSHDALIILARAKAHTITVRTTVNVTGGSTVTLKETLVHS